MTRDVDTANVAEPDWDGLPVDPTTDAPLGPQLLAARGWRARWEKLRGDSPSWLLSVIMHFVCFLLLTTVAGPRMPRGAGGTGRISLVVGFSEQDQDSVGPTVAVEPLDVVDPGTADVPPTPPSEPTVDEVTPQPLTTPQPTVAPPRAPERTARAARPTAKPSGRAREIVSEDGLTRISPYAALLNRHHPFSASSTPTAHVLQPLTELPVDPHQQQLDQIVDDFIAYDIGQLRGAAGARARERFANLGADSIPALVRGLNKAAGIHASCPVGVIAGKLLTTLRTASDPSLREYAINNVGVGVAETAPHYHRLLALRKSWLGAPALPPQVATIIERLENRQEGELMELMLALSDSPAETVVAALKSGDDYLAAAATLAIIQAQQPWTAEQRDKIRAAVVYFRSTTANAQLRSLADDAEATLRRAGTLN